jgi:Zn ribbon nucleic-acid-binding protein
MIIYIQKNMIMMIEILIFKKRATARRKRPFCQNGNTLRYWQSQ